MSIRPAVVRRRYGWTRNWGEGTTVVDDNTKIWAMIHAERAAVAETIEKLTPAQWTTPSLVPGWSVGMLAGHILRAAEQTPGKFFKQMAASGFRFDRSMDKTARESQLSKDDIVDRLRQ